MAKSTKSKIVVPIDFSEQALIALGQSYNLAREYDAEILLVHVMEEGGILPKIVTAKHMADVKKDIQKRLDKIAVDASKKSNIEIDTMIAKGKVYEKIIEVAEMVDAQMIIMGCNSRKKLRARFIGSNALRVVREARCPVITIKGKHHRNGCKNIVLPLDLTKETKDKVRQAIEIAKLGNKSAIRVVSVLQGSDEFLVNRLTRQLEQVKSFIQKQKVECTAEIIKTDKGRETLAQCVLDYANKVEGDLIIVMTQQEANITRMFIGSTCQEVVNNSEIPVMSIIPQMHKYQTAEEAAS